LPEDLYARLLAEARGGAALAETSDGPQPLCAVWPISALPAVRECLADGAHPPTWRVLEQLGARRVFFARAEAFANVNTRAELADIEARRGRSV
jgi:molybdopterin-guanine dinucleotide biosynthesis protein A